ncbi:MAG: ParB N-terminal domain-containing protein [Planctomycetota bacterium]|nr:ParB N-terminal domain-containing protein [Planctomycetota bacterium]
MLREKPAKINITRLPTEKLDANSYNPNKMSEAEFAAYTAEVKRLGRPPKPIIVRPLGNRFQIVDGEHAWQAAKLVKLPHIDCEVIQADELEARLQCFKRNQHGSHNPVLEGRLFAEVMKLGKLSGRKLAEKFGVSEALVRNRMEYVEAAELRTLCAPITAVGDISALTQLQVRGYLKLPAGIRDKWIDAGADERVVEFVWRDFSFGSALHNLATFGLDEFVSSKHDEFWPSLCQAVEYQRNADQMRGGGVANAKDYVCAASHLNLPPIVMNLLPLRKNGRTLTAVLSQTDWERVLQSGVNAAKSKNAVLGQIQSAVQAVLAERGIDPLTVLAPAKVREIQLLQQAPPYLQDATWLSLEEQLTVLQLILQRKDESLENAVRLVIEETRVERCEGKKRRGKDGGSIEERLNKHLLVLRGARRQQGLLTMLEGETGETSLVRSLAHVLGEASNSEDVLTLIKERVVSAPAPERALLACIAAGVRDPHEYIGVWFAQVMAATASEIAEKTD